MWERKGGRVYQMGEGSKQAPRISCKRNAPEPKGRNRPRPKVLLGFPEDGDVGCGVLALASPASLVGLTLLLWFIFTSAPRFIVNPAWSALSSALLARRF